MEGLLALIRHIVPGEIEITWGGITALVGSILTTFLGWDKTIEVLLFTVDRFFYHPRHPPIAL